MQIKCKMQSHEEGYCMLQKYRNPIISGFNPDPSICRVGDDFYLVTSSFEYFPGVPVYHSRNLADWECIGHCLTGTAQLNLKNSWNSGGIYAPTIRYHEGRFYMVTTNVSDRGNFIVHTDDIYGEWSEPVWVAQGGIDPSLLFADGKTYFVSNSDDKGSQGIFMCEVNPDTGEKLTESRLLTKGWCGRSAEAPHVYKIGDFYYLMLAEGGTEYGHMVTISRSRDPYGPYEGCPYNPFFSHRNEECRDITCTGHADLVEDQNGNWWMVALAVRCIGENGNYLMLHNLGRETFLAPVTWENGWPVVNEGRRLETQMQAVLPAQSLHSEEREDVYDLDRIRREHALTSVRKPLEEFCMIQDEHGIELTGTDVCLSDDRATPVFVGIRQKEFAFRTEVKVSPLLLPEGSAAGMCVFYTNEHHYDLYVTGRGGRRYLQVRKQIYDLTAVTSEWKAPEGNISLVIRADQFYYYLGFLDENDKEVILDQGATAAMCTEVTRNMTFTGTFLGIFCEKAKADFSDWKTVFIRE